MDPNARELFAASRLIVLVAQVAMQSRRPVGARNPRLLIPRRWLARRQVAAAYPGDCREVLSTLKALRASISRTC